MSKKISVFYSWQSDLPKETNQNAIRNSLRKSFSLVEKEIDGVVLKLDEATREVSGSPNIPKTIFSKIESSDIFVCDLSTINSASNCKRKVPNPNVLIELGFAISILGWERIILLFNQEFGNFPDDLPFDIDRHRTAKYSLKSKSDKDSILGLNTVLKKAIKAIIKNDPVKHYDVKNIESKKKKRDRDLKTIKRFLSSINTNTIDSFLSYMPNYIIDKIFFYKDSFEGVISDSTFHIYDVKLNQLLENYNFLWEKTLSYYRYYHSDEKSSGYKLTEPSNIYEDKDYQRDVDQLNQFCLDFSKAFKSLIKYIKENYIEIDVEETNRIALDEYLKHTNEKIID